jgi:phosphomannomutase
MLEALVEKGESLSALVEKLPKYYLRKAKVECPHELKRKAL